LKSSTRVETDDRQTYTNAFIKRYRKTDTHYINNKTIRPRLVGSWTANVDFVQSVDFVDFDI